MIKKTFKILPPEFKKKSTIFVFFLIFATILETLSIGVIFPLIELVINGNFSENIFGLGVKNFLDIDNNQYLIKYLIILIIFIFLFKSIYLLLFNYWHLKFSQNIYKSISTELLKKYFSQSIKFHHKKNSSELLRNTYTECKNYGNLINVILKLAVELLLILFLFTLVLYIEPIKTIKLIIPLIFFVFIYYSITKKKIHDYGIVRSKTGGEQIKILNESFSGIRDIKLKSSENFFLNLYKTTSLNFIQSAYKQTWIVEAPRVIVEFIFILILLSSLLIYLNNNNDINSLIPLLSLYVITGYKVIPSIMKILNILQQIKGSKYTVDILYSEFEKKIYNEKNQNKEDLDFTFEKNINLSNISFSYAGGKTIIKDLSLIIEKNSCVGIVGKSGAGKSTMIDLITGLLEPSNGKILVDNFDIQNNLKIWQSKIGYVSQKVFLLDETIKKNIAFGVDESQINEKLIIESLKNSKIFDHVKKMKNGIDTFIGEQGIQLSGGQKQRIAIARELYRNPEILILDEATSGLDEGTENQFLDFLENLKKRLTIIIVSHRKNTLKSCDKIIQI